MPVSVLFAGVPVADYALARPWYERLMGRPADMLPNDIEAAWQVTEDGWIYVVADPDRAGRALLTLIVDDLDAHIAALADRGLATEAIETLAGVGRTAAIADPEGNKITFAEVGAASRR
jgi:predicted enzyme related to lactoylglutathione lyase